MKRQALLITLLFFSSPTLFAQFDDSNLMKWLSSNYDTTIALYRYSVWNMEFNLEILAKKGNMIDVYSYKNSYRLCSFYKDSADTGTIEKKPLLFDSVPVDTNYFFVKHPLRNVLERSWNEINLSLWSAGSEPSDRHFSKDSTGKMSFFIIHDSNQYIIYLLTTEEIKALIFYDPHFFENRFPGNKNRIAAIKLIDFLSEIFK